MDNGFQVDAAVCTKHILLSTSVLRPQAYDTWPSHVLKSPNVLRVLLFSSLVYILSRAQHSFLFSSTGIW